MAYKDKDYTKNYNAKNYYHLACYLQANQKEIIKNHIAEFGYNSTADFMQQSINDKISADIKKSKKFRLFRK